uniref:PARP12-like CCCH zinc finger tandem domain-containing protein n=1 Tax=Myripristis murdjan TaxID=586833 RepID=A0A667X8S1_9TELE
MSEVEAAVLKLICANHGSMSVDDLEESVCVFNVRRIISNREKFVCCRSGGEHKVVAKTELRLCKAKVCQGCNNLHLCRKFLLGSCPRGCQLPHQLRSDHNVPILVEHGLQELDRAELCTLLLQNDNFLLPPVSTTPNVQQKCAGSVVAPQHHLWPGCCDCTVCLPGLWRRVQANGRELQTQSRSTRRRPSSSNVGSSDAEIIRYLCTVVCFSNKHHKI